MQNITKRRFLGIVGLVTGLWSTSLLKGAGAAEPTPRGKGRLLQGPMAGAVSSSSIRIWLRASDRFSVSVVYGTRPDLSDARKTPAVRPQPENDLAAVVLVGGLHPGTTYYYRVLLNDSPDPYRENDRPYRCSTAPAAGSAEAFSVGIGSCARYAMDPVQPIWRAVKDWRPDLFFWLGDNIYGDSASAATLADEYKRQRSVDTYLVIGPEIPQMAIWDDHDYAFNDSDRTNPVKEEALRVFRNFWANPAYGNRDTPGVFFDYSYGSVHFFFLDVRYYRDPNEAPDGPSKTMLGRQQKAWLKEGLEASTAPFKVLLSGSGWTRAKGFGGDSWASFESERNELFEFIRRKAVTGVVLVSGDTHVAELNAVPWSEKGGYDMYDLTSSPLAQIPSASWLDRRPELRVRQAYSGSPNFGLLTFRLQPEPVLSYNVVDHFGAQVWEPFEVRASELRNGVSSWRGKMDELSRIRYERQSKGEPYYQ